VGVGGRWWRTKEWATARLWPFTVVWTRFGATPRRETRSPSPNSRLMTTPGTRCTASARFLSGSLFTSLAAMASTIASDSFLTFTASRRDSAMPTTVISWVTGLWAFSSLGGLVGGAGWGCGWGGGCAGKVEAQHSKTVISYRRVVRCMHPPEWVWPALDR